MTSKIYFISALLLLMLGVMQLKAEKPAIRMTIISTTGLNLEFLSKAENEVDESSDLIRIAFPSNKQQRLTNNIDITPFILPEKEVDDLDFDTKKIFNELMENTFESK